MPSAGRRLSRTGRASSHIDPGSASRGIPLIPTLEPPNLPKHFPFPNSPMDSDLFFDFLMVVYATIGAGLQFLYLYRSVWWLPTSYTKTTMNFYLIDPNLVVLIVVIFLRRLYYQGGCKLISRVYSNKTQEDLSCFSRSTLLMFYATVVGTLAMIVLGNRGKMDIVYLLYPITLYIPIFGFKIQPFFEISNWCSNGIPPIHACSSNPAEIRKECEHLKSNFLDRLRQVFFTAAMNAYYGSFIPCCFSQQELVYDRWWNIEHGAFIFVGSMVFSFAHMIPLRYCDTLHRAVLHSGTWKKVDNEWNVALVVHEWRDDVLWPGGALVKYNKSMWRAMGDCNCIIPGDTTLTWGHQLFILPSYPLSMAAGFQIIVILYQLYNVFCAIYWYRIAALAIMCFFNYYSLYKLVRDSMVSYRMYKQSEESDGDKDTQSGLHGEPGIHNTARPHNKNRKYKTDESHISPQERTNQESQHTDER
ncbi:transmembrane protein 39A [Euwallacea fornicatus]|uniref:transmembrane protein 39A n=1 Tax=Euwallacea fornicatus TaxID=995702 RepID=UPI00338F7E3D